MVELGLGCIAVACALAVLWLPAAPPGTDAPQHLLVAAVRGSPATFSGWLEPNTAWTGQGFGTLAGVFARFTSLRIAAAMAQTIPLLLAAIGVWGLARRWGGQPAPAVACVLAFLVGWLCAMGFFNFTMGVGFGLAGVASLDRGTASSRHRTLWRIGGALLLTLAVGCHMYAGGLCIAHAILLRIVELRHEGRTWRGFLPTALPLLPAVVWAALCLRRARRVQVASWFGDAEPWLQPGPSDWIEGLLWMQSSGHSRLAALATVASLLGLLWIAAKRPAEDRSPWRTFWAWLLVFLLLPVHGMGWAFIHMRAGVFLWALPWVEQRGRQSERVGYVVAVLACCSMLLEARSAQTTGTSLAGMKADLFAPKVQQVRIVVFDGPIASAWESRGPHVRPTWHAGVYAALTGSAVSMVNDYNLVTHGVRPSESAEARFPDRRQGFVPLEIPVCARQGACPDWLPTIADRLLASSSNWAAIALIEPPLGFVDALESRDAKRLAPAIVATPKHIIEVELPPTDVAASVQLLRPDTGVRFGRIDGAPDSTHRRAVFRGLPAGPMIVRWTDATGVDRGNGVVHIPNDGSHFAFTPEGVLRATE